MRSNSVQILNGTGYWLGVECIIISESGVLFAKLFNFFLFFYCFRVYVQTLKCTPVLLRLNLDVN